MAEKTETPAAVVTDGTLSRMRVVRASLKDLPEAVRKAGLTPPGIITVGEVCAFHFTSMVPGVLTGITVGVTGTEAVRGRIISRLSDEGAKTVRAGESFWMGSPWNSAGSGVCGPFALQMGDFIYI